MSWDLGFAYAQARVQARFAGLAAEDEWQRLAATRTLASFLEEARAGPLRDWVKGFSSQSDVHDLEAGLRSLYRETLDEVSGWVPKPWHPALSWTGWLIRLPLLAHAGAGGALPAWVARDPELRLLLDDGGVLDPGRLECAGARCLIGAEEGLVDAWVMEWRRRWPGCGFGISRELDSLAVLLKEHAETFGRSPAGAAWSLRKGLRDRLRVLFRLRTLQPAVPFAFLALTALDLERLRASLVSRVLFSEGGAPAWPADRRQAVA